GEFVQTNCLACLPDAPNQSFARNNRVQPQESLECDRVGCRLLQNIRRNIHQRRTTFRDECGRKLVASAISHIKRAAVCIENTHGSFNNEAMQFLRSNRLAKGLAQTMQEIKDEGFLDLNFLMRAFKPPNSPRL